MTKGTTPVVEATPELLIATFQDMAAEHQAFGKIDERLNELEQARRDLLYKAASGQLPQPEAVDQNPSVREQVGQLSFDIALHEHARGNRESITGRILEVAPNLTAKGVLYYAALKLFEGRHLEVRSLIAAHAKPITIWRKNQPEPHRMAEFATGEMYIPVHMAYPGTTRFKPVVQLAVNGRWGGLWPTERAEVQVVDSTSLARLVDIQLLD